MNIAHIIETALIIAAAFLVGAILGYVIRCLFFRPEQPAIVTRSVPASPKSAPRPAPEPVRAPTADADGRPIPLSGPRGGKKDELKRIKGIGPKIEGTLNELGIYHFDQIAGWSSKTVEWVDGYLTFRGRIQREDWITQARKLARGEATEFSKRVDRGTVPSSKKK